MFYFIFYNRSIHLKQIFMLLTLYFYTNLDLCDFGIAKVLVCFSLSSILNTFLCCLPYIFILSWIYVWQVTGETNISYIYFRYYGAPELIFGAAQYTTAIDMWSTGCVLAEFLLTQKILYEFLASTKCWRKRF